MASVTDPASTAQPETDDAALWIQAVLTISDAAQRRFVKLPALRGRLESGTSIAKDKAKVLQGKDGHWHVQSDSGTGWYTLNGRCNCRDLKAEGGWCKHKFAANITRQAMGLAPDSLFLNPEQFFGDEQSPAETEAPDLQKIPPQWIQLIHGKPFVRYPGLLAMAHGQGLIKLTVRFVSVTPLLAVAEATAVFQDGREFTEAADATPENVKTDMQPHFARLALTRAKARCLRDALNIGMCAVEEVE